MPNVGVNYPNVGVDYPNVGVDYPNVGVDYHNVGGDLPNVVVDYPNFGVDYPNVGVRLPNIRVDYPNIEVRLPNDYSVKLSVWRANHVRCVTDIFQQEQNACIVICYKSFGFNPVCLAILESIFGPISSPS